MAVEIPIQAVFEKYKAENAQLTERAIIAETAQGILEQQNAELTAQLQFVGAQLQEANEARATQPEAQAPSEDG